MRIAYITATLPFSKGAEGFFIPEIKTLCDLGHDVLIVPRTMDGTISPGDAEKLIPITLQESMFSWGIFRHATMAFVNHPFRFVELMALLLKTGRANLVKNLMVLPKGLWIARIMGAWKADHIHAHWAATTATMGLVASAMTGISWSFTAHRGDIVQNNLLHHKILKAKFVRYISESGVRLAENIVGCNVSGKARVIHMGVCLPPAESLFVKTRETPTILCPANLIEVKGHKYLLRAIAILKEQNMRCCLLIAGDGDLLPELMSQVQELNIGDRCTFLGQVPQASILNLYEENKVDIVVLPSIDLGGGHHEGIPVSLIEAMSYGVPVVSTTTGGIPELLRDGAGVMVPDKNADALANAIRTLHESAEYARGIGISGRKRIEDEYDIRATTLRLAAEMSA